MFVFTSKNDIYFKGVNLIHFFCDDYYLKPYDVKLLTTV